MSEVGQSGYNPIDPSIPQRAAPSPPPRLKPADVSRLKKEIREIGKQIVSAKDDAIKFNLSILVGTTEGRPSSQAIQQKVDTLEAKIKQLKDYLRKPMSTPGATLKKLDPVASFAMQELKLLEHQRNEMLTHLHNLFQVSQTSSSSAPEVQVSESTAPAKKKRGGFFSFISRRLGVRSSKSANKAEKVIGSVRPEPVKAPLFKPTALQQLTIETRDSQFTFKCIVDAHLIMYRRLRGEVKDTLEDDKLQILDDYIKNIETIQRFEQRSQQALNPISLKALQKDRPDDNVTLERSIPIFSSLWGPDSPDFAEYMEAIDEIQRKQARIMLLLTGMDKTLKQADDKLPVEERQYQGVPASYEGWLQKQLKTPEIMALEEAARKEAVPLWLAPSGTPSSPTNYLQRATRIDLFLKALIKDLPENNPYRDDAIVIQENVAGHNRVNQFRMAYPELRAYEKLQAEGNLEALAGIMKSGELHSILKDISNRLEDVFRAEDRRAVREFDISGVTSKGQKAVRETFEKALKKITDASYPVILSRIRFLDDDKKFNKMKLRDLEVLAAQVRDIEVGLAYFPKATYPGIAPADLSLLSVKINERIKLLNER